MPTKISIITPSFNQGQFLEETIDSVLSQNYPRLEYVVIDGGSTDDSVEVIRKYEKHLKYWVSEGDRGQSHAINKGLARCTGDVFNWLNSDDYLEPGALDTVAQAFEDPECSVFIGRSNVVKAKKVLRQSRGTDVYAGNLSKTLGWARIDQPEHWWRRSVIDEMGPLNEGLHFIMDRDWWVKYLLVYGLRGVVKSDAVLANFRLQPESKTVSMQPAFNAERNRYFASLARNYELPDAANALARTLGPLETLGLENLPEEVDRDVLAEAIQYFFVLLYDELYQSGDHRGMKTLRPRMDLSVLGAEERALVGKLDFRSKFPASLVRAARKLKG